MINLEKTARNTPGSAEGCPPLSLTTFTYVKVGGLTVERIYLRTLLPLGHRVGDPRLREEIEQGCLDSGARIHRATLSNHLGEILEHFSFPHTKQGVVTRPHWTEPHILFEENEGKFIAYDEAGLEHSKWDTQDEARDALVIYAATELENKIRKYKSTPGERGGEL